MFEHLHGKVLTSSLLDDLAVHEKTSDEFFSKGLLDLLNDHFKCGSMVITVYENGSFIGGASLAKTSPLLERFYDGYSKQDPVAKYITTNNNEILKKPHPIVKASDLIPPSEFINSTYWHHLQTAGCFYTAVLVFKDYRLIFYKEQVEGDFTEYEQDILIDIHNLLSMKYNTYKEVRQACFSSDVKSRLLDDMNVGFMMFDEGTKLVECNQSALYHVNVLFEKKNIATLFTDIMSLFESKGGMQDASMCRHYKGYSITVKCISELNCYGQMEKKYCVSIARIKQNVCLPPETMMHFRSLSGREREILAAFCDGTDYHEIAAQMYISENTVRTHLKNIYRKLRVNNQRSLVKLYSQYSMFDEGIETKTQKSG